MLLLVTLPVEDCLKECIVVELSQNFTVKAYLTTLSILVSWCVHSHWLTYDTVGMDPITVLVYPTVAGETLF